MIRLDPALSNRLRLGGLHQADIRVSRNRSGELDAAITEAEEEVRRLYGGFKPSEIPGLHPARMLFRSIGVDPTRMRPASEALVRRALKGLGLPEINSAVDAANLVSLRFMAPIGLYDLDQVKGRVLIRLGGDGESFQRIGSGVLNLKGRLGLFDEEGGFGNPTGDSRRTSITADTVHMLFVAFLPFDYNPDDISGMIERAGAILTRFTGGTCRPRGDQGLIGG